MAETTKRYLMAAAAHNLGRVLFKLFGVGKPRGLQGFGAVLSGFSSALAAVLLHHHRCRLALRLITPRDPGPWILAG